MAACKGSGIGEHKFRKFDDESLFCERCGERKVIAEKPTVIEYSTFADTPKRATVQPTVNTNAIAGAQTATPRGVGRPL